MTARTIRPFLFPLLFFISFKTTAQNTISGNITDSLAHPITGVNITWQKTSGGSIQGFTISNAQGHYQLKLSSADDSIKLSFSHVGFLLRTVIVKNISSEQNITLFRSEAQLKEVVIKSPPIHKNNDTITFNANSFANKEDRVIGDVIKKLPGIEMRGDKILYNGKEISHYYINGLDMLGGQYSLANNNLPFDAVKNVQIIEHDQPIKMFDSLITSNRTSLNVQLKKFTTTGSGHLAAGAAPTLWNANLTPMTFNKSFQMINSFQANNTGDNVAAQLKTLTVNDLYLFTDADAALDETRFTGVADIPAPPFDENRWLDNNIKMFSSNLLRKFSNELMLTSNISYVNDLQNKQLGSITSIYTPSQNINVTESIKNRYLINDIKGRFILSENNKHIFLTDKLFVEKKWLDNKGNDIRNTTDTINQKGSLQSLSLTNVFAASTLWGKQLVLIGSTISYTHEPQQLLVNPGPFAQILNDSMPYNIARQNVNYDHFYTDNSLGFNIGLKNFTISAKAGISIDKKNLNSYLSQGSSPMALPDNETNNNLQYNNYKAYFDPGIQFKNARWKLNLEAPISLNYLALKNPQDSNYISPATRFNINPVLWSEFSFSSYWRLSYSANIGTDYARITDLYRSYILTSYQTLQRSTLGFFNQNENWNNTLALEYNNTATSSIARLSASYMQTQANSLSNNIIDSLGLSSIIYLPITNTAKIMSASLKLGKYLGTLKTSINLQSDFSIANTPQILEDINTNLKSHTFESRLYIVNNALSFVDFNYNASLLLTTSSLSGKSLDNTQTLTQRLEVNLFPWTNQMLSLNSEYYVNNYKDQAFLNARYTYSISKRKLDFSLNCINLLDSKFYNSITNSSYTILRNRFLLRPRQFLAGVRFNFK